MLSDAIDTVLSSYSSVQDQKLYHLGKNRDKIHHEIRKKESKTRFGSEQCVGKQTHLLEIYKDTSEQYAQLHADLLASMKENGMYLVSISAYERQIDGWSHPYEINNSRYLIVSLFSFFFVLDTDNDMYDQIQQQYSTILVAASIMLGNLVADLVQGKFISWEGCANLNGVDDCNSVTYPAKETFVTTLYSISNSLSLGFLFISIIFALQVLVMVRGFMQKRSKEKTKRLRDALQHSKEILEGLREFSLQEGVPSNKRESYKRGKKEKDYFPALDLPLTHDHHGSTSVIPPDKINQRRNIAKLTLDEVNNVFEISEPKLKKALQESEDCINKLHIEFDAKTKNQLFDGFFYDEVEPIGDVSIFSFYAGSFAMFYSFSTWMWTVWTYGYENSDGAMISQYVLLLLLLVIFMIVVYMRFEMYRDQDMSEMIEHLQEKQDPGMEGSFRERLVRESDHTFISFGRMIMNTIH